MPNVQQCKPLIRRPLPSQAFTRALDSLRQGTTSLTVLKDLLDLGAAPENMPQIATDSAIVPTCMGLLQQHCAHSSVRAFCSRTWQLPNRYLERFQIFGENGYGVICIRLIALRVQVNLLESTGYTFNDDVDAGYNGPTLNLRALDYTLLHTIVAGYHYRRPEDPPDLFRTSVGLVHAPPVLNADQAGRLFDYLYRERVLFLRANVSGTLDWAGWPFLFHALWERLMFQNGNKTTRLGLKFLDICYRFLVIKPGGAVVLEQLIATTQSSMSQAHAVLLPVNLSDRDEITKAYINVRFTDEDSDAPTMALTHSLFTWVVRSLDTTRANQVVDFMTTSCDRLWVVLEDTKKYDRVVCINVTHEGGVKFSTDLTELFRHNLLEGDIFGLVARLLMMPLLSKELETFSAADKSMFLISPA
ncbi:hypothetical protein FRC09_013115 [Ceratobasidium sp. 395]|nr:hypothetical protein FRC09_013115 [Ceratobasidium sp. 395]